MKKIILPIILWMVCCIACTEDLLPPNNTNQVQIRTNSVSAISSVNVYVDGIVLDDGGNAITERGVVFSTTPNPRAVNAIKVIDTSMGNLDIEVVGFNLKPNTTYYVYTYATNSLGTVYGQEMSVKTLLSTPTLSSPASGSIQRCCNISFSWLSVTGATQYELQISKNASFTGTAYTITNCTGTTILQNSNVNVALPSTVSFCVRGGTAVNNGTWYWRVRAGSSTNVSSWSPVRTFVYTY